MVIIIMTLLVVNFMLRQYWSVSINSPNKFVRKLSYPLNPSYNSNYHNELTQLEINEEVMTQIKVLKDFILSKKNIMVITGAGVSTRSGIPDYRGPNGSYKKGHKPIQHNEFISEPLSRQRYWTRSIYGWNKFNQAYPNDCHNSLTILQKLGYINTIITQNVDRLHQKSGAKNVIDLHGRNDQVKCMSCEFILPREIMQDTIKSLNINFINEISSNNIAKELRADGDAEIDNIDFSKLQIPKCPNCKEGVLKPNVIFFGDHVPKDIVDNIYNQINEIDGMLVIGTSLEVFSSYRFVERANNLGNIPIIIINAFTETRAERKKLQNIKMRIDYDCSIVMKEVLRLLSNSK